jgi:hypothetical protein
MLYLFPWSTPRRGRLASLRSRGRRLARRGEFVTPTGYRGPCPATCCPPPLPGLTEPFRTAAVVLVFVVDLKVVADLDQYLDRVGVIGGASIYPFVR